VVAGEGGPSMEERPGRNQGNISQKKILIKNSIPKNKSQSSNFQISKINLMKTQYFSTAQPGTSL
jgi:hypothetical protein